MVDITANFLATSAGSWREILMRLFDTHLARGAATPGGGADPERIAQAIATVPDNEVDTDRVTCPVTLAVTATTRAGAIPVRGVVIEADGKMIGRTDQNGKLRGVASACEGRISLKAIYENQDARLKREEFTIEITGIDPSRRSATGGRARNFISKVQDVFGSGEGGYPGDKDFTDEYDGAALVTVPAQGEVQVSVPLATLSLAVPYRNQNDRSDTVNGVATSGSVLCMPSSAEMQLRY